MGCGCREKKVKKDGGVEVKRKRLKMNDVIEKKNLISRGIRFGASMIRWLMSGFAIVDKRTLKRRRKTCLRCLFVYTKRRGKDVEMLGEGKCPVCGCYVRFKTLLKTEGCPLQRW